MRIEVVEHLSSRMPHFIVGSNSTLYNHNNSGFHVYSEYYIPEEIRNTDIEHYEGELVTININAYERNAQARKECLDHYGVTCCVCGVNLEDIYGIIAKSFIHVHHIVPLSKIKKGYMVNGIRDLRPVCPNCHAMLHKHYDGKDISIEELQLMMSSIKR